MLAIDSVEKRYRVGAFGGQQTTAVRGVTFDIAPGEVVSLIGESGSGKSTIGKMVLRLVDISAGTVSVDGKSVAGLKGAELRDYYRVVQGVFQDPFSSFNPIFKVSHIFDLVRTSYFGSASSSEWRDRVAMGLEHVGLDAGQVLHKYPHQLSGGQLQRLLIARALLLDIRYLVADEIISMLDASTRIDILNLLGDLKAKGVGVLFITHDLSLGNYISERTVILRRGRIAEMGATGDVFDRPLHPYTRMLLASVPSLRSRWGELLPGERAGAGWTPPADEPCLYHDCDEAQRKGVLAEPEPGRFLGCVHPNADGSCGRGAA
jgi:peptide/nickel transport system ATP-binding protein